MPIDVRMPDGTLITGVPDNITQADLMARFDAFKAQPVTSTAPEIQVTPQAPQVGPEGAPIPSVLQTQPQVSEDRPIAGSARKGVVNLQQTVENLKLANLMELQDAYKSQYGQDYENAPPEKIADLQKLEDDINTSRRMSTSYDLERQTLTKKYGITPLAQKLDAVQSTPEYEKANTLQKFQAIGETLVKNPGDIPSYIGNIGLESLPNSLAMMASAVLARYMTGSSSAAATAGGASSSFMEFGNQYVNARDQGKTHQDAMTESAVKSGVIGYFDAVSFGSAGKALEAIVKDFQKGAIKATAKEVGKETGKQAGYGAAGEAVGSVITGQEIDPRAVVEEALGEIAGAPMEAVTTYKSTKAAADAIPKPPPVSERIEPEVTPIRQQPEVTTEAPVTQETAPIQAVEPTKVETSYDTQAMLDELSGKDVEYVPEEVKVSEPTKEEVVKTPETELPIGSTVSWNDDGTQVESTILDTMSKNGITMYKVTSTDPARSNGVWVESSNLNPVVTPEVKEEPTGVISETEKEFTPVGGRLINKADADKLARESATALQQNLAAEEEEKQKQLKQEAREEKFREPPTQTLSARLVQEGGISRAQKRDMLGETGKIEGYDHVFREKGGDLLTLVKDGKLDEYLPPDIRTTATTPDGLFDARPGYNYISDLIKTGEKIHTYDYEMAKLQHENMVYEKNLAKQQMTPNEAARAAAAEEQGKVFLSQGQVEGGSTPDIITQSVKNELGKEGSKLLDNEKIIIVKDINELREKNYLGDRINQLTDNTRALYDPVTDRSYFISDRMKPSEVRAMAMHEVGTHYGMKKMLGDAGFKTVLNNVKRLSATDSPVRKAYNETLKAYSNLLETNPDAFYEEVLAYLGETAPNHSLWKQILQKVKAFLIKYGIVKDISASELQDLVMTSLRRASYEKAKPLKAATETKVMSSEKEQIKKIAGWTDDRLDKLMDNGTYSQNEKFARKYAVMMTPDEFLGLTTNKDMMETLEKEADEMGPLDINTMREYDLPMFLDIKGPRTIEMEDKWGSKVDESDVALKVKGHEGRHRAILMKRAGVESFPVILNPEGGGQVERDTIRVLKLFPQFTEGRAAVVRNAIPLNRLYENELKGMLDESTIKYSQRPPRNIKGQEVIPQWHGPEESKIDTWIYRLQNNQIDTKRVQELIGDIEEDWNVYDKEQLYHGRTAAGIRNFLLKELLPVIKEIERLKISPEDIRTYLHNRHAEERNNQMNKINPDVYDETTGRTIPNPLKDKGSGISTDDARAYLAGLDPARKQLLEQIATKFDQMVKGTQQILINSGAESQDTINKWNSTYEHYVPLFRIEDEMARPTGMGGTGQGFGVRGAFSKRAMGSEKDVQDILSNIIAQRERALIRAEKIRVGRALYGLAIQNPNPDFWLPINPDAIRNRKQAIAELRRMGVPDAEQMIDNLMAEPKERYLKKTRAAEEGFEPDEDFDFDSGLPVNESKEVVASKVNVMARYKDFVFPVRINGKDRYIFFNKNDPRALRMVQALKNLDVENLGYLESIFGKFTRWFKNVNTQYNPVFGIVNFLRDFGGTFLNLTNTEIKGKQAQVIAGAYKAMGGILNVHRAERKGKPLPTGPWATLYQEYRDEGSQTGYRDSLIRNQEEMQIIEHTLEQFKDNNTKKAFYAVLGGLTDYNDMMENAFRLSAYKVARDQGLSKQKAAIIAKNLTVNFDRKGAWTASVNVLYAFFNASVQGTERIYQTLKGPKGKMIIGGGILAGMIQAVMLAAAGYGDDDPPEFVREKNFIIPLADGTYITVPYPLGYNILPNSGRIIMDFMIHGGRNPGKHMTTLMSSIMNSFNPLGSSGFAIQTLMPTAIDPLVALAENRDAFGRPIYRPDRATAPTPGYTRSRDTSSTLGKGIAEFLNWASGGTKYTKGYISPTADEIDFLAGQVGGGLYREISKAAKAVGAQSTGEALAPYQRPLVSRFYGETGSPAAVSQTFYNNITRMTDHENEIKGRMKNREDVQSYLDNNPEARLWKRANSIENKINELNKRKRTFIQRGYPKERIQAVDAQKTMMMQRFNDQVSRLKPE